jgi:hypothetical protein
MSAYWITVPLTTFQAMNQCNYYLLLEAPGSAYRVWNATPVYVLSIPCCHLVLPCTQHNAAAHGLTLACVCLPLPHCVTL